MLEDAGIAEKQAAVLAADSIADETAGRYARALGRFDQLQDRQSVVLGRRIGKLAMHASELTKQHWDLQLVK